jgi:hypothetical protein
LMIFDIEGIIIAENMLAVDFLLGGVYADL